MYVFQAMGGGGTISVRVHITQFFPKTFAQGRFAQKTVRRPPTPPPPQTGWMADDYNEIASSLKEEQYIMAR